MVDTEERPVLTGLVALASVAVVVGLLAALAVLVVARMVGLDGDVEAGSRGGSGQQTLYLPEPTQTSSTVEGQGAPASGTPSSPSPPGDETPAAAISLSASQLSVSAMQQIDLTGTYPQGEGAILQVQRLENGRWTDFPVTISVSDQTFSTYVQTSRPGPNKFRVRDTDNPQVSNVVTVTVD